MINKRYRISFLKNHTLTIRWKIHYPWIKRSKGFQLYQKPYLTSIWQLTLGRKWLNKSLSSSKPGKNKTQSPKTSNNIRKSHWLFSLKKKWRGDTWYDRNCDFRWRVSFAVCVFGAISKDPLPNPRSQRFAPVFSSKSGIGLALLFSVFDLFWVNFFHVVWGPTSFFFMWEIQLSQSHFLKRPFFSSMEWSWLACQKSIAHKC